MLNFPKKEKAKKGRRNERRNEGTGRRRERNRDRMERYIGKEESELATRKEKFFKALVQTIHILSGFFGSFENLCNNFS